MGPSVSAEAYLRDRISDETVDENMTDYESSGSDEESVIALGDVLLASAPLPSEPKATKNTRYFVNRKRGRTATQTALDTEVKQVSKKRRKESTKVPLQLDVKMEELKIQVTGPGWIAKRRPELPQGEFTANELTTMYGFTYFPWDGRKSHLLLDTEKRIIGVLLGHPGDEEDWNKVQAGVFDALKSAAARIKFSKKEKGHRRGEFPAVAHGISFGGGQEVPRHLRHGSKNMKVLEELMGNKCVQRVCKFGSRCFELYSERNYRYMKDTVKKVRDRHGLHRAYDGAIGVFPCRSFNLGEQSVSLPHCDEANLVQSWCSITPFGHFDAQSGGHLVLWDFGLVVEFPAGSTAQIPSALVCHSNTRIQKAEKRYSMIQYASGGLFRWVCNGFMSEEDWKAQASAEEVAQRKACQQQRWKGAVEMFTVLDELLEDRVEPSMGSLEAK